MAFDGITIANIKYELTQHLIGGRIYKIAQPEKDALLITVRCQSGQYRLLLSANPSLPLVYLAKENRPAPLTAPNFCMLLRKHLQNGRIVAIHQPGLERILQFDIEHLDELGDLCQKSLIVELMGKHSNIIFCDENMRIIDSIKHVSAMMSSVREVLPGKDYFIPHAQEKANPLTATKSDIVSGIFTRAMPIYKAIYSAYTGISPIIAQEACYRAGIDSDQPAQTLSADQRDRLSDTFVQMMQDVKNGNFSPAIVYEHNRPREYASIPLTMYTPEVTRTYETISDLLVSYYEAKDKQSRIRQKSADLRHIVQTALERDIRKYDLQLRQIQDTQKRDKYRIYGELLNTYGYQIQPGDKTLEAENYYNGEMVTIPLDTDLTPLENARKYFDKYNKLKRTYEALSELTLEVKAEIDHLESISAALDIAIREDDLTQIRQELVVSGFVRSKSGNRKIKITSRPFHYRSSDGYDIYVGKNNLQNDELTFKVGTGNDWWFHAKKTPGSHVLVKSGQDGEITDRTFEEAAALAAYYSKGRDQNKVEIDYTRKKNVKKPGGGAPGFVVYYTNFSMIAAPVIDGLQLISD